MTDLMPTGPRALRLFAEFLDRQAARYDAVLWRPKGERSTVAETYRQVASQARQQANRLELLASSAKDRMEVQ